MVVKKTDVNVKERIEKNCSHGLEKKKTDANVRERIEKKKQMKKLLSLRVDLNRRQCKRTNRKYCSHGQKKRKQMPM